MVDGLKADLRYRFRDDLRRFPGSGGVEPRLEVGYLVTSGRSDGEPAAHSHMEPA